MPAHPHSLQRHYRGTRADEQQDQGPSLLLDPLVQCRVRNGEPEYYIGPSLNRAPAPGAQLP